MAFRTDGTATLPESIARDETPARVGRVLVVDDDDAIRRTIHRALSSKWDVTAVSSGEAALEAFSSREFDVLITDLSMPTMGGLALTERVRRLTHDLPVILITGNPSIESAVEAIELRAFKYLTKPFELGALRAAVGEAMNHGLMAQMRREALIVASQPDPQGVQKLQVELDRARRSLWIAYQPIVNLRHEVFGYEALLRWRDGDFDGPVELLAAADHLGAGEDLGIQIRTLAPQPFGSRSDILLFMNLDPNQLGKPYMTVQDDPLSRMADRVVLELTEHMSIRAVQNVEATVLRLREIGFGLAVDDLGAGYSGLTSFAQIGPSFVKLDRSLVAGVCRARDRQRVISGINRLCRELGIQVIAEGVEDRADFEMLAELQCDFFQGYLIGRPGPLE
jgi:EAL domain-containing protein (putative c-di-GMP-specific phosphodiesterase class I)